MFSHHIDIPAGGLLHPPSLPTHGGVYLIADREDRPILLAACENLRRVVAHRLAVPPPDEKTKRTNLAQIAARVYWRETFSRFESAWAHCEEARRLYPDHYRKMIGFGPVWFARVDLEARIPRLSPVRELDADGGRYVGPFAERRHAEAWIEILNDLFDLCRYHEILEQSPHGQPCAYFEMGKCPAPCNGSISLGQYRQMMAEAAALTAGLHGPRHAMLRQAMQTAASSLAFEKAASIRQTIERAEALTRKAEYRHVGDLASCCWLVLQRGGPPRRSPKTALVKPFFIRCGDIEADEPASLADLAAAAPRWLERCRRGPTCRPASADVQRRRSEVLWLVGKFLFQHDKAPGLFYRFNYLPEAPALIQAVRSRFGQQREPEGTAGV